MTLSDEFIKNLSYECKSGIQKHTAHTHTHTHINFQDTIKSEQTLKRTFKHI